MNSAAKTCFVISILCLAHQTAAGAEGKLPYNVRVLTSNETVNIYANKTIDYRKFKYYFGPDGYLVGYTKNLESFAFGDWHVEGNEICMRSIWQSKYSAKTATYRTCNAWYFDGAEYWTTITRGGLSGNVYKGDAKLATEGDQVSEIANKLRNHRSGARFTAAKNLGRQRAAWWAHTRQRFQGQRPRPSSLKLDIVRVPADHGSTD